MHRRRGWVRIDPTAAASPRRIQQSAASVLPRPAPFGLNQLGALINLDPGSRGVIAQIRFKLAALNNGWNQWVLNYTQSKQLGLLRNLGFQSPSWEDLSRELIIVVVVVALGGAVWSWWDRLQHDPWLRLLGRARKRLRQAGVETGPATTPREIAKLVTTRFGANARGWEDWLLKLECEHFVALAQMPKTQERIAYMLKNGKPLRN